MRRLFGIAACVWAGVLPSVAAAEVFKCKDRQGGVIYSNEPCADIGAKTERTMTQRELRPNTVRMPAPKPRKQHGASGAESAPAQSIDPDLKIYEGAPPPGGNTPRSVVIEHRRRQSAGTDSK